MGIFEEHFPQLADAIQRRRAIDLELDEICRDYELLVVDLQKILRHSSKAEIGLQSDLRTSLAGLRQEILARARSE